MASRIFLLPWNLKSLGFRSALVEFAFPIERVGDDGRKIVEARLPAERSAYALAVGDNARRVAVAPSRIVDLEVGAGDALYHVDHFEDREAVAVTAIERQRGAARTQVTQRVRMGLRQVADMD